MNKQINKQDIIINSMLDELSKIASAENQLTEEEKQRKLKKIETVAETLGFIGGAALGAYTGDIAAQKLLKIKNPKIKTLIRIGGAGALGYAGKKIVPELKKHTPDVIRSMMGERE